MPQTAHTPDDRLDARDHQRIGLYRDQQLLATYTAAAPTRTARGAALAAAYAAARNGDRISIPPGEHLLPYAPQGRAVQLDLAPGASVTTAAGTLASRDPDPLGAVAAANTDGSALTFTVPADNARLAFAVTALTSYDGDTILLTIRDAATTAIIDTVTATFETGRYDNLGALTHADNLLYAPPLAAGAYTVTATTGSGYVTPARLAAYPADPATGTVAQLGHSYHSGPTALLDPALDPDIPVTAHCRAGSNERDVLLPDGTLLTDLLPSGIQETQERYHSCVALVQTRSAVAVFGTDHGRTLYGRAADRWDRLPRAPEYQLAPNSSETTYCLACSDGADGAYILTRDAHATETHSIALVHIRDLTQPFAHDDPNVTRRYLTPGSRYPLGIQPLRRDDGGLLLAISWQYRQTYWKWPHQLIIFDTAADAYYTLNGDALNNAGSGADRDNPVVANDTSTNDQWYNGGPIILYHASEVRYPLAPPALKIVVWNPYAKIVHSCGTIFQKTTDITDDTTYADATEARLWTIDGADKTYGSRIITGATADIFGGNASPTYRLTGANYWRGADLILAVTDRGAALRTAPYGAIDIPLYYDMGGPALKIYRIRDAITHRSAGALEAAVEYVTTFSHADLGGHADPNDDPLPIQHVEHLPGSDKILIHAGYQNNDPTQITARTHILDLAPLL